MTSEAGRASQEIVWLDAARRAGEVRRSHARRVLRHQSVAEHTFNGLMILDWLIRKNCRMQDYAVHIGLYRAFMEHDLPEYFTGDVPANAKSEVPGLREALHRAEDLWMSSVYPDRSTAEHRLKQLSQADDKDYNVLIKAADWLELMWYCVEERELGNTQIKGMWETIRQYTHDHEGIMKLRGTGDLYEYLCARWKDADAR